MPRTFRSPAVTTLLILCLLPQLMACGRTGEAPSDAEASAEAQPQRTSNAAVGVDLVGMPEGFRLVSNEGEEIVLERKPELPPGTAVITGFDPEGNLNLVAAVNDQKAAMEERPEGSFQGQTELGSHFGPAYLARGRWVEDGTEKEEMKLFSLHPTPEHMLVITYTYPLTGDTKDRATQIMDLLASLEAPQESMDGSGEAGTDVGDP